MPRKGENIYKRKDGRWEARYIHHYENGKAKYKSICGASYTEVRAKRQEELLKPKHLQASCVKKLATLFRLEREQKDRSYKGTQHGFRADTYPEGL